jgi:hypothetical protein
MSVPVVLPGPQRLAPDQKASLSAVAGEWARSMVATGPVDRVVAEAGARSAYRAAGLSPPARVVWTDSPLSGAVAAAAFAGLDVEGLGPLWERVKAALEAQGLRAAPGATGRSVRAWVGPLVWSEVRVAVEAQLGGHLWRQVWERVGLGVLRQLPPRIWGVVVAELREALDTRVGWRITERLWQHAVTGEPEAVWCAAVDGLRRVLPDVHGPERLTGLLQVVGAAGWWWPFEQVVIMSERPVRAHRDEQGRFHRPDGPALDWSDGFALHALHGLRVPASLIARLPHLRVEHIRAEPNVELRRVMLEHYGSDRYLRDAGATRVHEDDTGTLWRAEVPNDQPVVMVEVVNATPEPDGTRRSYWLRVPPAVRSAREGVAWTFGLDAEQYRPLRET